MNFKIGSFNKKQTMALAAILIGVILMIFAAHGMHEAQEAKGSIDEFTGFFTNSTGIWNPVIKFFGGEARDEASKYDTTLAIFMILGIVLVVAGFWGISRYRTRR